MNGFKYTNRLIHETSPYLLQHAHNPVNWYSWGKEALQRAKQEDKPIFLSIGYAACHWCHVMEEESFENLPIAEVLNKFFISIKVDREERPDLDEIYMSAVTLLSGSGGWPLSVWLTPELKPFFGGTYFPPDDKWGRIGFKNILLRIADLWQQQRKEILAGAENLSHSIRQTNSVPAEKFALGLDLWKKAALLLANMFDEKNGGLGRAPKFPRPMDLSFLLRYHFYTDDEKALHIAEKSLQAMARGGIFDQLGGGFHRYATDEKWLIPHFEKMLYDNALLPVAYLEAYQITGNKFYAEIVSRTLDFVLREMTSPEGGFFSSLDADSDGKEGKFYVWTKEEIYSLLDKDAADAFCLFYGVREEGNWEGKTVLHLTLNESAAAKKLGISQNAFAEKIKKAQKKLLRVRQKRSAPSIDNKIITAWNSLMIIALCRAYQTLGQDRYLSAAKKAVDFLLNKMYIDGKLYRIYGKGKRQRPGYLSDYALLTAALLEIYMTVFDARYLILAVEINDLALDKFWDRQAQGFFFTSVDQKNILMRTRNEFDNVIPSGNSMAIRNLFALYQFTGKKEYKDRAYQAIFAVGARVKRSPIGFPVLLSSLETIWAKAKEIVLSGNRDNPLFDQFLAKIHEHYFPNKIIGWADPKLQRSHPEAANWPLFVGKFKDDVQMFICENFTCHAPLTSIADIDDFFHNYRATTKP
ncbi:MAG: thioredoxin domain-containing protein [Calditrichaeota bacterium]|nr:thioredoxin domain-containing protein [Calditrichota bacterium]